jgi:hypothetical protein
VTSALDDKRMRTLALLKTFLRSGVVRAMGLVRISLRRPRSSLPGSRLRRSASQRVLPFRIFRAAWFIAGFKFIWTTAEGRN